MKQFQLYFFKLMKFLFRSLLVFVAFILIRALYVNTFDPLWARVYNTAGYDISDLRFYGANKEFVLVQRQEFGHLIWGRPISMSQGQLINVTITHRADARANYEKLEPNEKVIISSYELEDDSLKKEEYDLIPLLKNHGFVGQMIAVTAVTYQGKDYLKVRYELENEEAPKHSKSASGNIYEEKLYDVENDRLLDYPDDMPSSYRWDTLVYLGLSDSGLIDYGTENFDLFIGAYAINDLYREAKDLSGTNLYVEEPELAKAFEEGYALYVRPDRISDEAYFNKVIHWFAPAGQEVLELYTKDKETGEKTLITSYADYVKWAEAHPQDKKGE